MADHEVNMEHQPTPCWSPIDYGRAWTGSKPGKYEVDPHVDSRPCILPGSVPSHPPLGRGRHRQTPVAAELPDGEQVALGCQRHTSAWLDSAPREGVRNLVVKELRSVELPERGPTITTTDIIKGVDGENFFVVGILQVIDEFGEAVTTIVLRNLNTGTLISQMTTHVRDEIDDGSYRL